jgi:hypothetical protein
LYVNETTYLNGALTTTGNISTTGNVFAANFGIGIPFTPNCRLDVQGIANIRGTSPSAVPNNRMASGSLTIGSTDENYGINTGWTSNTAGLRWNVLILLKYVYMILELV